MIAAGDGLTIWALGIRYFRLSLVLLRVSDQAVARQLVGHFREATA